MDPVSMFVSMLVALVIPFVVATVKNPASIAKMRKSLPALKTVYASIGQLISVIEGGAPASSLAGHLARLKRVKP